ncbi:MAG: hypothetical protein FWG44_07590 [Oscillospiraceae bacterium]|nr:hypothetical protein [Oscillospiraceae bacterium]
MCGLCNLFGFGRNRGCGWNNGCWNNCCCRCDIGGENGISPARLCGVRGFDRLDGGRRTCGREFI